MNTKKKISISLMVLVVSLLFALPVMAEDAAGANGFYDIDAPANVSVKAFAGDEEVQSVNKNVDADAENEAWYENSDRLEVSYSAATEDGYYGAILVEGSDLPTRDDAIFFIDQVTAATTDIKFNVYPKTPEATTDMTLYISSSIDGEDLVRVQLGYAVGVGSGGTGGSGGPGGGPAYTVGDINNDDRWNSTDALLALQIGAGIYSATDDERASANVNGDERVNSTDALMILQYGAGIIDSWN